MNERQKTLKEMAQEFASRKGGFEDVDFQETIEDLCNELFSENPAEAVRAMYFGEISGWNSADGYRLNAYGNLEEVDDIGEEIDGQEEDIVDAWLELHEDSRESELLERYHNAGGEYGLDGDEKEEDDVEE